ncbi:hypothetical protein ECE50_000975 [Chitinophaga sp. Mgbs1]|uniref:Lipoprotein n=1 Tax=Chitinophaga solisilvae TaxID=1233460 RepID=A0A9Q5GRN2_9BACT|nr:hypothetical protein [Chitinophaga solisilvae]
MKIVTLFTTGLGMLLLGACSEKQEYGPFTVITGKQQYRNGDTGSKSNHYTYRIKYKGKNISPADVSHKSGRDPGSFLHVVPVDSVPGKLLVHIAHTFESPVYLISEKQHKPGYHFLYNNSNDLPFQLMQGRYLVYEKAYAQQDGCFITSIFDLDTEQQRHYRLPASTLPYDLSPDRKKIAAGSAFTDNDTTAMYVVSLADNHTTALPLPESFRAEMKAHLDTLLTSQARRAWFVRHFRWVSANGVYTLQLVK